MNCLSILKLLECVKKITDSGSEIVESIDVMMKKIYILGQNPLIVILYQRYITDISELPKMSPGFERKSKFQKILTLFSLRIICWAFILINLILIFMGTLSLSNNLIWSISAAFVGVLGLVYFLGIKEQLYLKSLSYADQ